jgi:hypothetical protein
MLANISLTILSVYVLVICWVVVVLTLFNAPIVGFVLLPIILLITIGFVCSIIERNAG